MLRLICLLLCVAAVSAGSCTLHVNVSSPGVFWRQFMFYPVLLDIDDGVVKFDDRIVINASCQDGFKISLTDPYSYSQLEIQPKQVSFSCSRGAVYHREIGSSDFRRMDSAPILTCDNAATFIEASVEGCEGYGLAYALFLDFSRPLFLAEVCFDMNTTDLVFAHYVAANRIQILGKHTLVPLTNFIATPEEVILDGGNKETRQKLLNAAISETIPHYADVVNYEIDSLLPLKDSLGAMGVFTSGISSSIAIPWWTPLKRGNWKRVQSAIDMAATSMPLDIFAGTSDWVYYPSEDACSKQRKYLTYEVNQVVHHVPLYVWNLVRQKQSGHVVVIIGINSPFFERTSPLCNDICESISWLAHIHNVRKISALGYVFCCEPFEVKDKLENLPAFIKYVEPPKGNQSLPDLD